MYRTNHRGLFLSLCLYLATFSLLTAQSPFDLVITNVNVIDVVKGRTLPHQQVCISKDRIVFIGKSPKNGSAAVTTIDGTGKFLIPGLWDMHTHNWWQQHFSGHYIANGVLGVRNMYTPMHLIQPVKDSIAKNLIPGPEYVAAGRVLEGAGPEFPDWLVVDSTYKIPSALDTLVLEGSDFVKVYNKIPREIYFELLREATKRGLEVHGHLPMSVSALEASIAGQRSLEHLLGIPDLCTHDSLFRNRGKYKNNWFASVMKEDDYGTMVIDEKLAARNFSILKKNHTYICPTLVVWRNYMFPDLPFDQNERLSGFPDDMVQYWAADIDKLRKKDSVYKKMAVRKYETLKKVTYLLYKSGVPMIAGTDVINPYCYPGYSLHEELQLLKECQIPDAEILKMATINAATFLGKPEFGQVKEGCIASLVLLDANPLENIGNTSAIHAVILKGTLLTQDDLMRLKQP